MNLEMQNFKKKLALLWFIGAGILFFIVMLQAAFGKYGERTSDVWGWLFPTIMPTLSLIIGVLVTDARGKATKTKNIDRFLFLLTFWISFVYLFAVLLTILLQPLTEMTSFELMSFANLWLGPFQGLVAGAIGVFFVKESNSEGD